MIVTVTSTMSTAAAGAAVTTVLARSPTHAKRTDHGRETPDWDAWGATGFDPDLLVDNSTIGYSGSALPDLDETNLNETNGVSDGNAAIYWVDPGRTTRAGDGRLGLDWDWDSSGLPPFESGVNVDINGDRVCVTDGDDDVLDTPPGGDDVVQGGAVTTGPDRTCNTASAGDDEQDRAVGFSQPNALTGFDDWQNIKYRAAMSPDAGSPGPLPHEELTFELSEQIKQEAREAVNRPPVADAGGPYVVAEEDTVVLDGTGSTDPDGDTLSYSWTPTANLDDATSPTPVYSGVDDTVDDLTLTVTDPGGLSASDTTTVTVENVDPSVSAVGDAIDEGSTATVTATFTDPGILDTHTAAIDWGDGTARPDGPGPGCRVRRPGRLPRVRRQRHVHGDGDHHRRRRRVRIRHGVGGGGEPRARRHARPHRHRLVPRRRRLRRADRHASGPRRLGHRSRLRRPDLRVGLGPDHHLLQRRSGARPVPEPSRDLPLPRQ
jgi:hypothetical protein